MPLSLNTYIHFECLCMVTCALRAKNKPGSAGHGCSTDCHIWTRDQSNNQGLWLVIACMASGRYLVQRESG